MGSPQAAGADGGAIRPAQIGLSGLVLAICAGALSLFGLNLAEAFEPGAGLEALQVAETVWLALTVEGLLAGAVLAVLHPLALSLGARPAPRLAVVRLIAGPPAAPCQFGCSRRGRGPGSPRASPL